MKKPVMRKEVAIEWFGQETRTIHLWATPDAINDFQVFGGIIGLGVEGKYSLEVDLRYDFNEVLAYIQNYER